MNIFLNRFSSQEAKKNNSETFFSEISDYLFDKVNFLNNPGLAASAATTSTTTYDVAVRVPDTSGGLYLRPDRRSRLRTVFYIVGGGASKADAYILSPCLYPSSTSISAGITTLNIFNYYVGISIKAGAISLVSKDSTGTKQISTSYTITGTSTNKLEILYNVTHADIYVNDSFLGSISVDTTTSFGSLVTIYPLIAPIRSIDGTSVEIDLENYQFIQEK